MRLPPTPGATLVALFALGVAGLLGPGAALLLLARAAGVLVRSLAAGEAPLDPVLGLAACGLSALLLGWWSLGVSLATWSTLTRRAGRVHGLAARLSPPLARRAVATLLGATLAAGAAAPVAAAEGQPAPRPGVAAGPGLAAWSADRPAASAGVPGREVVVRAGDTLWDLAARALGPDAEPAQVDRAWRRWYAANRAVIGPDPDLLHPGQRLRAPGRPR